MENRFIKYSAGQVNLSMLYRNSESRILNNVDVREGTLVVGYSGDGKYLAMGYLKGLTRTDNGEVLYEIVNAIEGEVITFVKSPCCVNTCELPYVAVKLDRNPIPFVGQVFKCNGRTAVMDTSSGSVLADVDSILGLTPLFKETK